MVRLIKGEIYYAKSKNNTEWIIRYTIDGKNCYYIEIDKYNTKFGTSGGFWNLEEPNAVKVLRLASSEESQWLNRCILKSKLVKQFKPTYELW